MYCPSLSSSQIEEEEEEEEEEEGAMYLDLVAE
jgi:hypothetical protein